MAVDNSAPPRTGACYHLPCHPSTVTSDPLGVADVCVDDTSGATSVMAWAVVSQLLQPSRLPKEVPSLLDWLGTIAYSLHETDLDLSTLRTFLAQHPEPAGQLLEALPRMCTHALAMPQLFPGGLLSVLTQGQDSVVTLSRQQVSCLLVHMFLNTLPLPAWSQWWSGFSIWYSTPGRPPQAYLHCLIHYFHRVFPCNADSWAKGAQHTPSLKGDSCLAQSVSPELTAAGEGGEAATLSTPSSTQQAPLEPEWGAAHASGRESDRNRSVEPQGGVPGITFIRRVLAQAPDWGESTPPLLPVVSVSSDGSVLSPCRACQACAPSPAIPGPEGSGRDEGLGEGSGRGAVEVPQAHAPKPEGLGETSGDQAPWRGKGAGQACAGAEMGAAQLRRLSLQLLGVDEAASVVFSNKEVSFGPAGTQEEQVFGASPELCVAVLLCPPLADNEVLLVQGAAVIGVFEGYGPDMRWAGTLRHPARFLNLGNKAAAVSGSSGSASRGSNDGCGSGSHSGDVGGRATVPVGAATPTMCCASGDGDAVAADATSYRGSKDHSEQDYWSWWDDRLLVFMDAAELDASSPDLAAPDERAERAGAISAEDAERRHAPSGAGEQAGGAAHVGQRECQGGKDHDAVDTAARGVQRAAGAARVRAAELRDPSVMRRELNKAFCGFAAAGAWRQLGAQEQVQQGAAATVGGISCISTGHWGCGAFGGDRQVKALLQLMAASQAGLPLLFQDVPDTAGANSESHGSSAGSAPSECCTCTFGAALARTSHALALQGHTVGWLFVQLERLRVQEGLDVSRPFPLLDWVKREALGAGASPVGDPLLE